MSDILTQVNLTRFVVPAGVILAALVLGWLIERFIVVRLRNLTERTKWRADNVIVGAIKGMVFVWTVFLGVAVAVIYADLPAEITIFLLQVVFVLFGVSVTIVAARVGVGLVDLYYHEHATGAKDLPSPTIFENIVRVAVLVIGTLIILQSLGISIAPALAALGVGGLAVSLALQDTLSNLFAGIQILFTRQIRPGQYVQLENGFEGYITDINWRTTKIRQLSNNMVIVPNATLSSSIVTNYYDPETEMSVLIDIGVSYDSNLRQVERVTNEVGKAVMQEVTGGVPANDPFIRYNTFGDSSINFTVILRAQEFVDQYLLKHEFIMRLHERYQQEGIEIPFPIRTLYTRDASVTIHNGNGARSEGPGEAAQQP